MNNEEIILKTFTSAGKPLKAAEIAEMSGLEKKEVDKIIKQLKSKDKIYSPKRCYYEPKI
jgi:chromosome segregation and condensation protein ScpB